MALPEHGVGRREENAMSMMSFFLCLSEIKKDFENQTRYSEATHAQSLQGEKKVRVEWSGC